MLAWPDLSLHSSPAQKGFAFPLQWGYLFESGFLTDDVLVYNIYDIIQQHHTPWQVKENGLHVGGEMQYKILLSIAPRIL